MIKIFTTVRVHVKTCLADCFTELEHQNVLVTIGQFLKELLQKGMQSTSRVVHEEIYKTRARVRQMDRRWID